MNKNMFLYNEVHNIDKNQILIEFAYKYIQTNIKTSKIF